MATLMLSSGIPMIQLGDSVLQSQGGNNNPYCQDNATSWVDWSPDKASYEFRDFVRGLYALRQSQPALRRTQYAGKVLPDGTEDVSWVNTHGNPMTINEWRDPQCKTLGVLLKTPNDEPGDTLFIAMSGLSHAASFVVPAMENGKWQLIMDTSHDKAFSRGSWLEPGTNYTLADRSLAVFAFRPA
jgi:glycogen operon protein